MRIKEAKDHLINRLDLTQEQKDKLIALFRKYPNLESKIDWNNKNLKWEDFKSLLYDAGKSKSQALKKGLEGLREGVDYQVVAETDEYIVYYPMTHLASKVLASDRVAPHKTARWCISTNDPTEWTQYTRDYGVDFFFFFGKDIEEDGELLPGEKYAIARYPEHMKQQLIPRLERNHLPYDRDKVLCEVFTENDVSLTEHDYTAWPFRAYGFSKDRISEEAWPSYFESPEDWFERLRANNPDVHPEEDDSLEESQRKVLKEDYAQDKKEYDYLETEADRKYPGYDSALKSQKQKLEDCFNKIHASLDHLLEPLGFFIKEDTWNKTLKVCKKDEEGNVQKITEFCKEVFYTGWGYYDTSKKTPYEKFRDHFLEIIVARIMDTSKKNLRGYYPTTEEDLIPYENAIATVKKLVKDFQAEIKPIFDDAKGIIKVENNIQDSRSPLLMKSAGAYEKAKRSYIKENPVAPGMVVNWHLQNGKTQSVEVVSVDDETKTAKIKTDGGAIRKVPVSRLEVDYETALER